RDRPARVVGGGPRGARSGRARDGVDRAHRALLEPARRSGIAELASHELLDDAERDGKTGEREGRARETVECALRRPAGARERRDPPLDGCLVWLEPRRAAGEHVERRAGDELRAEERLIHAVTGERVDEARGVADHGGRAAGERAARTAQRQPVAAQAGRTGEVDAVRVAEAAKVVAQPRSLP